MFNKLKLRKAPLSLNSVSNAIKNAGSVDLSPTDINPKHLDLVSINQLGVPKNSILAVAFDPVQSLLAVSTTKNEIRVFGQEHVEVVFEFNSSKPIDHLKFVKGVYLVAVSSGCGDITVISLHSKQILSTYSFPGSITSCATDPSLDWLMVGLSNGSIMFYDVDRLSTTPYRIDNLQKKILSKQKLSPAYSLEWHPRDIGTILVAYSHCAVVYSMTSGEIQKAFVYEISKDARAFEYSSLIANDFKKKMFGSSKSVIIEAQEAHFHPNGLHVVTVHKDGTLAFWDVASGTLLEARSVVEVGLNGPGIPIPAPKPETFAPINCTKWVTGKDPEVTQLVVSEGPNLHVLDFGYTLKYSLASYEKQKLFYANPQGGQRIIPLTFYSGNTNSGEYVRQITPLLADFLPYFNGGHCPAYLLLETNFNSIHIISFSVGEQGSTDLGDLLLPTSLGFVHPPVTFSSTQLVKRIEWYSILSNRALSGAQARSAQLLRGGAAVAHTGDVRPLGDNEGFRTVLVTGHEGGLVRLVDISRSEHLENESIVQISLKETLYDRGNLSSLNISHVSVAFESREMLVALATGEVVVCRFGKRPQNLTNSSTSDYSKCPVRHSNDDAKLLDITGRISGRFARTNTFLPMSLLQVGSEDSRDKVTCLKMSDIGFAAIGYQSGRFVVCDITRGPAVILNSKNIGEFLVSVTGPCYATCAEFSIMEYGQDGYSSVILMVGTNNGGNLILFKVIPQPNGAFQVIMTDRTIGLNYRAIGNNDQTESKLDQIIPVCAKDGLSAIASQDVFRKLSLGIVIPGYIVTSSNRDIRVLSLPKKKLSHKVIEDTCLRSGIIQLPNGILLALITRSGFVKLMSIPSLTDITDVKFPKELYKNLKAVLESKSAFDSCVLSTGSIFVRLSDTESCVLSLYNTKTNSKNKSATTDMLFNKNAVIPPRPQASALLWAKGQTKYVTTEDLAYLIAGPNRKPPKTDESTMAFRISPENNPQQGYTGYNPEPEVNERGYKEPVKKGASYNPYASFGATGFMKNLQQGLESFEEGVNHYANSASEAMTETVEGGKKSMYSAAIKSKFGF